MRPPSSSEALAAMRMPRKTLDIDAEQHDVNALSQSIRGFRVGTAGDVVVRFIGDAADRTIVNMANGETLVGHITHVRSTGTTATDIVGFA